MKNKLSNEFLPPHVPHENLGFDASDFELSGYKPV